MLSGMTFFTEIDVDFGQREEQTMRTIREHLLEFDSAGGFSHFISEILKHMLVVKSILTGHM